jgi:hypothetical protein
MVDKKEILINKYGICAQLCCFHIRRDLIFRNQIRKPRSPARPPTL